LPAQTCGRELIGTIQTGQSVNFKVFDRDTNRNDGHGALRARTPRHVETRPRLTLVVEAVDAVDGGALVIAAQQEEVLRVLDLVREQQADGLQALLPAVDVVAARGRRVSGVTKIHEASGQTRAHPRKR